MLEVLTSLTKADVQARVRLPPPRAFADHGPTGTGEPLSVLLQEGQRRVQHHRRPRQRGARRPEAAAVAASRPPAGRRVLVGAERAVAPWLRGLAGRAA